MISSRGSDSAGFTVVEILLVVILIAIFGGLTFSQLSQTVDSNRFETTRARMAAIRTAILGDTTTDPEGHRRHFGYHGDMGRLPANLTELVTQGAQPAWSFNTFYGTGAGWRGPYMTAEHVGEISVDKDAWGKTYLYNTAANPPTLISLGADNVSNGVLFATDQTISFPPAERLSSVSGILADNDTRLSTQTVEIRRPVNGALTATTGVTSASGFFSFSSIPFGVRAFSLLGPTLTDGPNQFVVEKELQDVPNTLSNTAGRLQDVETVGSPTNPCGSNVCVRQLLKNNSQSNLVFQYLTINWDRQSSTTEGFAQHVVFNNITQLFPPVPPATKVYFPVNVAFTANTIQTFEIHFVSNINGSGNTDVSNTKFYIDFEWVGGKRDQVFFQTP